MRYLSQSISVIVKDMKQFILIINGPSNAGKSTITELLLSRHKNLFRVSYDKIKWLISDYSAPKYHKVVDELVYTLAKAAFHKGFSLVADGAMLKETREKYRRLAANNKVRFLEINLDAPLPVLKARLKQRVASARRAGTKISVTTVAGMMRVVRRHYQNKNVDALTFDSSILTPKQIVANIEKLLT